MNSKEEVIILRVIIILIIIFMSIEFFLIPISVRKIIVEKQYFQYNNKIYKVELYDELSFPEIKDKLQEKNKDNMIILK